MAPSRPLFGARRQEDFDQSGQEIHASPYRGHPRPAPAPVEGPLALQQSLPDGRNGGNRRGPCPGRFLAHLPRYIIPSSQMRSDPSSLSNRTSSSRATSLATSSHPSAIPASWPKLPSVGTTRRYRASGSPAPLPPASRWCPCRSRWGRQSRSPGQLTLT